MAELQRTIDTPPDPGRSVAYIADWVHYYDRQGEYVTSERIVGAKITVMRLLDPPRYRGDPCPCRQCA